MWRVWIISATLILLLHIKNYENLSSIERVMDFAVIFFFIGLSRVEHLLSKNLYQNEETQKSIHEICKFLQVIIDRQKSKNREEEEEQLLLRRQAAVEEELEKRNQNRERRGKRPIDTPYREEYNK